MPDQTGGLDFNDLAPAQKPPASTPPPATGGLGFEDLKPAAPPKFGHNYPAAPAGTSLESRDFQQQIQDFKESQAEAESPWIHNPLGMLVKKGGEGLAYFKHKLSGTPEEILPTKEELSSALDQPTLGKKLYALSELGVKTPRTIGRGFASGTIQLLNTAPQGAAFLQRQVTNLAQKGGYLIGLHPGTVNDIVANMSPFQTAEEMAGLTVRKPGEAPQGLEELGQELGKEAQAVAPKTHGLVSAVSEMVPAVAAAALAPEAEAPGLIAALRGVPVAGRVVAPLAEYAASHPAQTLGAAIGGTAQATEAHEAGATPGQEAFAGLTGAGTGAVQFGAFHELLGPEAAFIGKGMHPITRGLSMATEGGLTMGATQAVNNTAAMLSYDPNRKVMDNVADQFALGTMLAAPGALLHPAEPLVERKLPIPRAEEVIPPGSAPDGTKIIPEQPGTPAPAAAKASLYNGIPKLETGHFDMSGLSPDQASDLFTANHLKATSLRAQMADLEREGKPVPPAVMQEYINASQQAANQGTVGEGASALPMGGVFSGTVRGDLEAAGKLPPHRAMFDLDNLKFSNDILGHRGTDYLLQQIGNAIGQDAPEGVMVFKGKMGDEFFAHSDKPIPEDWLKSIEDRIKNTHLEIVGEDGNVYSVKDTGISYGQGLNDDAAEGQLKVMKDEKLEDRRRLTRAEVDQYLERRKGETYEGAERRAEIEDRRIQDLGPAGRAIPRYVREAGPGERGVVGLRQAGGEAGGPADLGAGAEAGGGPGGGPLGPEASPGVPGEVPPGTEPAAPEPGGPAPERQMTHILPTGEKVRTPLEEAHHIAAFDKLQSDSDALHEAISANQNLTKEQRAAAHREIGKAFSQEKAALAKSIEAEKAGGPRVGGETPGPGLTPEEVKGLSAPNGTPEDLAARKAISAPVKQLIDMTRTDVNQLKTPEEMATGKDPGVGWQMEQARSQELATTVMTLKAASLVKDLTPDMQAAIRDYDERPEQVRVAPYLQKISEEFTQPLVKANRDMAEQLWNLRGEKSKAFDDDVVNYATRRALPDVATFAQTPWQKLKEALNRRAAEPGSEPKAFEYQPALSTGHYSVTEGRTMKAVTDAEGGRQMVSMEDGGKKAILGEPSKPEDVLTRKSYEDLVKERTAKPLENVKDAEAFAKGTYDSVLSRFIRNGVVQKWQFEDLKPEEAWRKLAQEETPYNNDAQQRLTKALAKLDEARKDYQDSLGALKGIDPNKPVYEGKDGKLYNLGQAATSEIEDQTSVRYDKNYVLNTLDQHQKLAQGLRNAKMIQEWGKSIEDGGFGFRLKDEQGFPLKQDNGMPVELPKGYDRTNLQLPGVQDMAYPKMMARAMDHLQLEIDRARNVDDVSRAISNFTGLTTRSIFLSPVGHVLNTAYHWLASKGWEVFNPFDIGLSATKGMVNAAKQIISMDPKVLDWMNDGAKIMSQRQAPTDWKVQLDNALREQLPKIDPKDPKLMKFAANVGIDPAELLGKMYKLSGSTLWLADDIMRLEALQWMEKRRPDLTRQQIIQEMNHHIASYESSKGMPVAIRKIVDNPNATMFNRYHFFRAGSFFGDLKNAVVPKATDVKTEAEARHEAIGRLAAIALLATGVQPALSSLYKKAYNTLPGKKDENIQAPAPGPLAMVHLVTGMAGRTEAGQKALGSLPPQLMQDIYAGPTAWQSAVQSNLTFNPFWIEAANLASGKNIMTGKERTPGQMVTGPLEALAPIASIARVARGEVPAKQELASVLMAARTRGTPAMQTAKYHINRSYGTEAPGELSQAQQEARTGIKTAIEAGGEPAAAREAAQASGALSPKQIENALAKAKLTPDKELAYRMSVSQAFKGVEAPGRAMEVWRVATPEEKKAIAPVVQKILASGLRNGAPLARQRAQELQKEFSRTARNP